MNKLICTLTTLVFLCLFPSTLVLADGEFLFVLRARGNPYWGSVKKGIVETAKELNIKATVYEAASDSSGEEQLNICLSALQRRPSFFAIAAVNPAIGLRCMKAALKLGIPIGEIDGQVSQDDAANSGITIPFSVGSDNNEIGRAAALYAGSLFPVDQVKVLVLEGPTGALAGAQRVSGFTSEIAKVLPTAQITASLPADWDRLRAMSTTTDILLRAPDINLIFAANDMMALGAVEAIKTLKLSRPIHVIGVDGTAEAVKSVTRGEMTATIAQLPYLIGKRTVELGVDLVKGSTPPYLVRTAILVLNKSALEKKSDQNFQYLK